VLSASHWRSELANRVMLRGNLEPRLWMCTIDLSAHREEVTLVYGGNCVLLPLLRRSQPAFLIWWHPSIMALNNLPELLLGKRCILYQNWLQIMLCTMHGIYWFHYKVFWYVSRINSPVRNLLYQVLKSNSIQIHFCIASFWISALPKLSRWAH